EESSSDNASLPAKRTTIRAVTVLGLIGFILPLEHTLQSGISRQSIIWNIPTGHHNNPHSNGIHKFRCILLYKNNSGNVYYYSLRIVHIAWGPRRDNPQPRTTHPRTILPCHSV